MRTPQNRDGSGRWPKGISGNPGGRPQGLAKATRELVGEDGMKLAAFWVSIMEDEMRRDSDRLEASKLLADRGWGKAPAYEPLEGDPLDLAAMEQAAEEFRANILRHRSRSPSSAPSRQSPRPARPWSHGRAGSTRPVVLVENPESDLT
jgi:Family of unknown function (DUF5681)